MEGESEGINNQQNEEGHKEHHTHHTAHKHVKKAGLTIKKSDLWMIISGILAVLLVVSIIMSIVLYTGNSSGKVATNDQVKEIIIQSEEKSINNNLDQIDESFGEIDKILGGE